MKHPDFRLQGIMTSSIKIGALISIITLLVTIGGCASTDDIKMTPEERAHISKVDVQETHSGLSSRLSGYENPISGFLGGTLSGFLYGILNPQALMMGGPLVTMTMMGARDTACGSAVGKVNNPSGQLQEIVRDIDPGRFRNELDSALQELIKRSRTELMDISHSDPADTILEIKEMIITLNSYMSDDEFVAECQPYLKANAKWRATTTDGQQIKEGTTVCSTNPSAQTFKEWFADPSGIRDEITWLLERLGRQVANDLYSDDKHVWDC